MLESERRIARTRTIGEAEDNADEPDRGDEEHGVDAERLGLPQLHVDLLT